MPRLFCTFILLLSLAPVTVAAASGGGTACVVAKRQGNSLAIEWVVGEASVSSAIARASQALRRRGYDYIFPQANSNLAHGWMVVIETEYRTYTGRSRTSYGCGFSASSEEQAEQLAVQDLRSYSWGWKPKYGYQVKEKRRF
ncbi:MAG TPA: hypothetical protein ENI96_04490 [Sedimenticola thiotaurini]|uniref:Uncharacterized protein n=1 Tax=Sedimenticola thiotaurini TaxID=1543721 RepID=A0A831W4M6_9GAMM|nr:hypothetical protein [Sedimenticola thiotaurini]